MKITVTKSCCCFFQIALVVGALAHPAYSSGDKQRAKAYRDINAIGHRLIGYPTGVGNWYSLDKEKEIGAQASAAFEKTNPILHDSVTESYLDRLAQVITRNSDAQLPISVRIIDSEDSYALTFAGGYQYITRGLLLKLQNEGELAAAIARGIAHTALRSATGELTRANLIYLCCGTTVPIFGGPGALANATEGSALGVPLTGLHFRRKDESAADYFGVQYLYKSGYAPECFISFVQKAWLPSAKAALYSPFPPLPERLDAVRREIKEILPQQSGAIENTEDFESFRKHLVGLPPLKPSPKQPILIRHDSQETN